MDRRNYLKSILALTGLGIGSYSVFNLLKVSEPHAYITLHDWQIKSSLISELSEIIIPETDTPGAKEAGVANYIISVMNKCHNQQDQKSFLSGLEEVEEFARSNFGKTFLECDPPSKQEIVKHFSYSLIESSDLLLKIKNKFIGKSFFYKLRELTVQGYCISHLGATKGLAYDPTPGIYKACIPLSSNQKSWATK